MRELPKTHQPEIRASEPLNQDNEVISPEEERKSRELLLKIIEDKNRSRFQFSREQVLKSEKKIDKLTEYEKTLRRLLECLGIHNSEIKRVGRYFYEIPVKKTWYKKLPPGYGYKGGMARAILLKELGIDPEAEARDLDPVRITEIDNPELDEKIAQEFSPADHEHGYGVEELETDYFETRDFTLNEVLVVGNKIYLSKDCLLDTARRIIRITGYEYRGCPHNKLLAKAIRLSAEETVRGRRLEISDEDIYQYIDISDFNIALHLDRALENGPEVAKEYIKQLIKRGQLSGNLNNPKQVIADIMGQMTEDGSFVFRFTPPGLLTREKDFFEEFSQELDDLAAGDPKFEAELKYGFLENKFDKKASRQSK